MASGHEKTQINLAIGSVRVLVVYIKQSWSLWLSTEPTAKTLVGLGGSLGFGRTLKLLVLSTDKLIKLGIRYMLLFST